MGMGTGEIPTTDNIPETTEKLGCQTDYLTSYVGKNIIHGNKYMSSDVRLYNLKLKIKTVNIKNFY